MIAKSVVAAASIVLISASPSLPARTEAGIDPATMPEVVRVKCAYGSGTAFYVGPKTLVSVNHVTSLPGCTIGGAAFEVVETKGDFSILRVEQSAIHWLQIDCEGFVAGKTYTAWGHARGLDTLTSVDAEAKGEKRFGFERLWGVFHAIPGQSGGPFTDPATRKAVGTVNVYDHRAGDSGSIPLKETSLCSQA